MTTKNTDTTNIKLTEELNKLKPKVSKKVWEEISQTIKVISVEGYKLPNDEDYAEMAGRVHKEAEKKVANRKKYASYGNMKGEELVRAWCSNPELRIEFDNYFQRFVSCILETFPDSPVQWYIDNIYLREFSQGELDRMIRDYEQKQASDKADLPNKKPAERGGKATAAKGWGIKGFFWKLYETTVKAFFDSFLGKS